MYWVVIYFSITAPAASDTNALSLPRRSSDLGLRWANGMTESHSVARRLVPALPSCCGGNLWVSLAGPIDRGGARVHSGHRRNRLRDGRPQQQRRDTRAIPRVMKYYSTKADGS